MCKAADLKTFDELIPKYRLKEHRGRFRDHGDRRGNQCLGGGQKVLDEAKGEVVDALKHLVNTFPEDISYVNAWLQACKLDQAEFF